uniref:Uncharacterized protein n=1 Tax=Odontella aurita TaxID=265563 RepID=A0A6U6KZ63_9STRA|mmetsp:Transcript_63231/g.186946  ORF Transcript_63231/g.186946 Transcript_63231/m.186946 type:complete len:340 (+) Transcript_63231:317-1336(+)
MRIEADLRNVQTRSELAALLHVDVKAIGLVSLSSTQLCTTKGCQLPAVDNNRKRCILCSQTWFPRKFKSNGKISANCRGYGLHGPQFMRVFNGCSSSPTCCCNISLCEEIGHSHEGMFRMPSDATNCKEALVQLNIPSDRRAKILDNPRAYWVAPWHYKKEHRKRSFSGKKWKLRKQLSYEDDDGVLFKFPPPNYKIQRFIDEEISGIGYARGASDDVLPFWMHTLIRKQEDTPDLQYQPNDHSTQRKEKKMKIATPRDPRASRKRLSPERSDLEDLEQIVHDMQAKMNSALENIERLKATMELEREEKIQIRIERDQLFEENAKLKAKTKELEKKGAH